MEFESAKEEELWHEIYDRGDQYGAASIAVLILRAALRDQRPGVLPPVEAKPFVIQDDPAPFDESEVRKEFEAWTKDCARLNDNINTPLAMGPNEKYQSAVVEVVWQGWLAATKHERGVK